MNEIAKAIAENSPLAGVLSWALWQHGKMWPAFLNTIEKCSQSNLAMAEALTKLRTTLQERGFSNVE